MALNIGILLIRLRKFDAKIYFINFFIIIFKIWVQYLMIPTGMTSDSLRSLAKEIVLQSIEFKRRDQMEILMVTKWFYIPLEKEFYALKLINLSDVN